MLYDIIYSIGLIAVAGGIAFFIGRRMAAKPGTKSKTTTFLLKSIQAIAELAVLEYRTEGVTEIKEKNLLFYCFFRIEEYNFSRILI